jgi:branched-chain amino acid transport system ATP-binding protein
MLSVQRIHVYYDGLQAIYGVSLSVKAEEFISIIGPNGAGKSTLLKTIAGLLVPQEGTIQFEGATIHRQAPHRVASMGIALIPEEGWLFPQMNVEENLLMGAYVKRVRGILGKQMDFVFGLFPRLKERKRQQAQTLSGGERQMLAIGRGLMADPKLLMLDEPSLGLAPKVVKSILQTLAEIHRQRQTTILLAEQNIYHALQVTQRGYVLENGRVVMENASEVLLQSEHIKRNYLGL